MRRFNAIMVRVTLPVVAAFANPAAPAATVPDELPAPQAQSEIAVIGSEHFALEQLPSKVAEGMAGLQRGYREQLNQLYLNYQRAQQNLLETQVVDLVEDRLLHLEAESRKVTADKLREQLAAPEPTDAAVSAFYDEHKREIGQPFDKAAPLIAARLKREAAERIHREFFDALEKKYSARVTLAPLRQPVDPSGAVRGSAAAPVTIVEFADFQCPYCRQMAPVLKRALDHYPHEVRLVYRNMPLSDIHHDALGAAAAALCAGQQGKFWEMHDALFADSSALGSAALTHTAESLGLDGKAFSACVNSDATHATIRSDYDAGVAAGVSGTPGLFVNGRYLSGAVSYERLSAIIDDELRRGGAAPTLVTDASGADRERR